MNNTLDNLKVIVTGGSGHLGESIVGYLLDQGAHVLNMSSKPLSKNNYSENMNYYYIKVDMGIREDVFLASQKLPHSFNENINGIVNLASRSTRGINLDCTDEDLVNAFKDVVSPTWNAISVFRKQLAPSASIINFGSMWGELSPDPRTYLDLSNEPSLGLVAAKSGLMQMTKYLSVLLATEGIRLNNLEPGWFPANRGRPREDYISEISSRIPMGRIGIPSELNTAIGFLLDPKSSYITGQTIRVDGGYSLW